MFGTYLKMLVCTDQNERLESNHPPFGLKSPDFKPNNESVARVCPDEFLKEDRTEKISEEDFTYHVRNLSQNVGVHGSERAPGIQPPTIWLEITGFQAKY